MQKQHCDPCLMLFQKLAKRIYKNVEINKSSRLLTIWQRIARKHWGNSLSRFPTNGAAPNQCSAGFRVNATATMFKHSEDVEMQADQAVIAWKSHSKEPFWRRWALGLANVNLKLVKKIGGNNPDRCHDLLFQGCPDTIPIQVPGLQCPQSVHRESGWYLFSPDVNDTLNILGNYRPDMMELSDTNSMLLVWSTPQNQRLSRNEPCGWDQHQRITRYSKWHWVGRQGSEHLDEIGYFWARSSRNMGNKHTQSNRFTKFREVHCMYLILLEHTCPNTIMFCPINWATWQTK